jgi:hypothetical protein
VQKIVRSTAAGLIATFLAGPALAASPLGQYRVAEGCAARATFEQEIERRLRLPGEIGGALAIVVELSDGAYVGRVTHTSPAGVTAERVVVNDACEQVLHALALIGALLLEPEPSVDPSGGAPKPAKVEDASPVPTQTRREPESVIAPPIPKQSKSPPSTPRVRRPGTWVTGPFFGLAADQLFSPGIGVGPRPGWSLTHHALSPQSQVELDASFAHFTSSIAVDEQRDVTITWTSLRLDACLGRGAHQVSTIGGCAWFDVGRLEGTGRVRGAEPKTKGQWWSRLGAGLHGRQAIVGALALDAKLGLMLATSRPEFYFGEAQGLTEHRIHRTPLLGLVADLGLSLHFW